MNQARRKSILSIQPGGNVFSSKCARCAVHRRRWIISNAMNQSRRFGTPGCVILALLFARATPGGAAELDALMSRVEDHTAMWWADGFPSHTPAAPWLRVVQTGSYALVLDTETLRIPHFGAVAGGAGDDAAAPGDNLAWKALPAAELGLSITVDGKAHRCTAGGKWSRFAGPRLIESGRFLQRADVTDLTFTADDGGRLKVEARFETAAWPDRLGLILAARPEPGASWKNAAMEIGLTTTKGALRQRWELPESQTWTTGEWREVSLSLDPMAFTAEEAKSPVTVRAAEIPGGAARPVDFDPAPGWHRVNLDGIEPIVPPDRSAPSNDAIERVKLVLTNPTTREQIARLMFEKTARGIRQHIGVPITGVSAILRDAGGQPTGIPVQLSKNWHARPEGGVYAGQWFHGISQVRLPPSATAELELTLAYGHWGGVAAASHAQLCLIGWGSNQLWNQSALGSWGESICFDPDQVQANCTITDVRPLMVRSMGSGDPWRWTSNAGGGDFFRLFDPAGDRIAHTAMRTAYHRQGPCLSEVTYAGRLGDGMTHATTVSLARGDDIVRGIYRIRLDVNKATDFSRFVIFQAGADTYNSTIQRKLAVGNEGGLEKEWDAQWGGNLYRTEPMECAGRIPWASLHDAVAREKGKQGAWANRGIVIRSWKARLGGKEAAPWIAERGLTLHGTGSSTLDIIPPPGIARFEPGDFVEATIEHVVMPQFAKDYYGPNTALRAALEKDENTWRMIHREAVGNDRRVETKTGVLQRTHPAVTIGAANDTAEFTLAGGLGYVPITFTGLTSPRDYTLFLDGKPLDQSTHGKDFWQTDYDSAAKRWSRTYNVPSGGADPRTLRFSRHP